MWGLEFQPQYSPKSTYNFFTTLEHAAMATEGGYEIITVIVLL